MGKPGHLATGTAFASIPFLMGQPLIALGIVLGSTLPDVIEISSFDPETGRVSRLIEHRTITHWFPPYVLLLAVFVLLSLKYEIFWFAAGLVAGCLHHILIDAFSPSGVPVRLPGRKHRMAFFNVDGLPSLKPGIGCAGTIDGKFGAVRYYTTGNITELRFGLFAVAAALTITAIAWLFV